VREVCAKFREGLREAEVEDGGAEAVELVGGEAGDGAEVGEGLGGGGDDVAEGGVREDEEAGEAGGVGFFATPLFEAVFEG
jgi:hypothetical protein